MRLRFLTWAFVIKAPSFLNVKLDLNKKNNLVELNTRIKKIESIENVFVQDFNKDLMNLRLVVDDHIDLNRAKWIAKKMNESKLEFDIKKIIQLAQKWGINK